MASVGPAADNFGEPGRHAFCSSRKPLIAALGSSRKPLIAALGSSRKPLIAALGSSRKPLIAALAWSNERAHPVADAAREVGLPGRGGGPRATARGARHPRGQTGRRVAAVQRATHRRGAL